MKSARGLYPLRQLVAQRRASSIDGLIERLRGLPALGRRATRSIAGWRRSLRVAVRLLVVGAGQAILKLACRVLTRCLRS